MLAYGIHLYNIEILKILIFVLITLYAGFFAALIWNDITDADVDAVSHPERPIPSGFISKKKFFIIAIIFSSIVFIFSTLISLICLLIVCFNALFVTFHDKYLKKKVKIPAYSEIFTPIQWIFVAIIGFFAIWTAVPQVSSISINLSFLGTIHTSSNAVFQLLVLIIFTYFADNAHDIAEGIVDLEGDKKYGIRTYATSFGKKTAAKISFIWFFISGIFGILLFLKTILSFVFLILFVLLWLYNMFYSYKLLRSNNKNIKKHAMVFGRKGFDYFLFSYNLIFLDILIQLLIFNFY